MTPPAATQNSERQLPGGSSLGYWSGRALLVAVRSCSKEALAPTYTWRLLIMELHCAAADCLLLFPFSLKRERKEDIDQNSAEFWELWWCNYVTTISSRAGEGGGGQLGDGPRAPKP